jgi:kynurenine formamidase
MPTMTDNWGRWGDDDERGALNLITDDTVLAATRVCRTGKVYGLGLPVQSRGVPGGGYRGFPQRLSLGSWTDTERFRRHDPPPGLGSNEDMLVLASHSITHMDALAHVFADHKMYNGFDATEFTTERGARHLDVAQTASFAGRAVLLDLPRHQGVDWLEPGQRIDAEQLEACRAAQGVEMRAGDILLVRTGWIDAFAAGEGTMEQAGLSRAALPFIDDHDVAVVGADNSGVECLPFDDHFLSVHVELVVKRGITMLEHLALTELAADGCHECLFVVGGLKITGGAGSPVNPIAIG